MSIENSKISRSPSRRPIQKKLANNIIPPCRQRFKYLALTIIGSVGAHGCTIGMDFDISRDMDKITISDSDTINDDSNDSSDSSDSTDLIKDGIKIDGTSDSFDDTEINAD
ncbi:hypothetical protein GF354_06405, partial [Candidatus Peregrinibacteria bacterium]|nr:hypothetical protein [Candidatus Peregrinibacteria bacterium]